MKNLRSIACVTAFSACLWMAGCVSKTETAAPVGELPKQVLTQAEADKQIQDVKNNPQLPEGAKQSAIGDIQAKVK